MQLIEFMLPFPVHIVDASQRDPIKFDLNETSISISKPLSFSNASEPDFRMGNEGADAHCTVIHVSMPFSGDFNNYIAPREIWPSVQSLLAWIRVKARHYWLLHGQTGFGSVCRGSLLLQQGNTIGLKNFCTYGGCVVVRPISKEVWSTIQEEMTNRAEIPVYESLFCDALVSIVAGEQLKAVLELGVAAEIAITQLLTDAAKQAPTSHNKRKFLTGSGEWDSFYKKLEDWPAKLGLGSVHTFKHPQLNKRWVEEVKELYRYRGGAAHSGRSELGRQIGGYMYSTNALLGYCRDQRERNGLPAYLYPPGQSPFDQIVIAHEAIFLAETNMVLGTFS